MGTRKKILGKEYPDSLISLTNLASTYRNYERWKEAEEVKGQVMKTSLRILRKEHPNTLNSMANLAFIYKN